MNAPLPVGSDDHCFGQRRSHTRLTDCYVPRVGTIRVQPSSRCNLPARVSRERAIDACRVVSHREHAAITTDRTPTTGEREERDAGRQDECGKNGGVCHQVAMPVANASIWVLFVAARKRLPYARTTAF